ncbi:extensin family protein [Rhizobium sp. LCM 4573]|uniref:extensin-like domain-containing protein n=1 Tax=Rhizobium sp. LCM 4573 TaxID=1848291 RepID=UPI0008D9F9EA|nr:extensin family protein [Rhizobium sp. LCM 4573]OHV85063.1 hypothetical protein LCM4573_01440 [Rhizobium sp. LCM 4573]
MRRSWLALVFGIPLLMSASLPAKGPLPAEKPGARTEAPEPARPTDTPSEQPAAETVPTPEPKPEAPPKEEPAPKEDSGTEASPLPGKEKDDKQQAEAPAPPPPPPLEKEDPAELRACLAELTSLGTKFKPLNRIDDGNGCGIEQPVEISEALPGISLGGAAMRCKTALAMAHWLKDTVQPSLKIAMPDRRITGIVPGSTYDCRLRNGASTGKISEHARGNAIDVAAFKLDNGETMEMKPRAEDSTMEGAFQRTATAGACLHFTTVLSPGSDAAHQDHLHLDVLERKDGYRYCR